MILSLKTQTRDGGCSEKIVRARFAPSRKANRSSWANFLRASFTPLVTKPSAQLKGGLVTMCRREKIEGDLAVTAIVKIRAEDSAAGFYQHLRHGAVAACALPNVTAEFFVVDQCERCPTRGGVKVRAIQVGETLNVGLKPPFKLKVGSGIGCSTNVLRSRLVELLADAG